MASASSASIGRIEKAPSGSSVSARISPKIRAEIGVRLLGLSTSGQPAAIAGATLWATKFKGKLKGVISATGPTPTLRVMPIYPAVSTELPRSMTVPSLREHSSAATWKVTWARLTSACAAAMGLPASITRTWASSSARSAMRFAT